MNRFLVAHGRNAPERAVLHHAWTSCPAARFNIPDGKTILPPKQKVLTGMEELIHQFMVVTQGVNAPPGEIYFSAETPRVSWVSTSTAKAGARPIG